MSVLFRTKEWLTFNQLACAWAGELPGAEMDRKRFQQDLAHLLLEDVANGRLDDAGPLVEGQRLGLRFVTDDFRAGFLEGRQILDALRSGDDAKLLGDRIVVMKEAVLAFAHMHNLPPPSWWQNAAIDSPIAAPDDMIGAEAPLSGATLENPANLGASPGRGRRRIKLERVKQAMSEDIQQGRIAASELENMLERQMEERYGVSRDTARKARKAVLPGFVDRH